MRCGTDRWEQLGEKLSIQRERGPRAQLEGGGILAVCGMVAIVMFGRGSFDPFLLVLLVIGALQGLYRLSWHREVVLDREAGTVRCASGPFAPWFRSEYALESFDSVRLFSVGKSHQKGTEPTRTSVLLSGPHATVELADTAERREAQALAEAVSRQLRLPLGVDGGQARAVAERLSATPLAEDSLPQPRPDSRIQLARRGESYLLELPVAGWTSALRAEAFVALIIAVGGVTIPWGIWLQEFGPGADPVDAVIFALVGLAALSCGGFLLWRAWARGAVRWRIRVSTSGLEVIRSGRWIRERIERISRARLKDVEVRLRDSSRSERRLTNRPDDASVGELELALEHEGGVTGVGAGMAREDLEWLEKTLRRMLAEARPSGPGLRDSGVPG
ncbi:hypothetical protein LZ198_03515 [Myxococcus sp. K15C18031901]|uniref:hypothetical protein n=1 Tax=Myxococcus dinghuensis TaxID=2906761 RepID=UPI0020A8375B|nr:hypothetical protein [Myxococcus dinghuensis]MCP3097940.1 hypothetical protein [Myxococcus dinghuensis]